MLVDLLRTAVLRPELRRRYAASRCIKLGMVRTKDPSDTRRWVRARNPTAFYARLHGIDNNPIMNGEVVVHAPSGASATRRSEPSLHRSTAEGGATVPADGRAGVVAPLNPEVPQR
jgi:hypothetical protein